MHNDLLGIFCNQKIIASNKKSLPENYARFLFCHIGNHSNIFIQFGESGSGFKINVMGGKFQKHILMEPNDNLLTFKIFGKTSLNLQFHK